jgi:hypothetical protein
MVLFINYGGAIAYVFGASTLLLCPYKENAFFPL